MFKINRPTFILIIFLCFISFSYGVFSYYKRWFPYKQIQVVKNSISGGSLRAPHVRNSMFEQFPRSANVVMIGDSITHWGEWNDIFPELNIANRGIAGDTVEDILQRTDQILALEANKAFIMAGINDIYDGLGVERAFAAYTKLVDVLKKENVEIFIQSTVECSKSKCGSEKLNEVRQLNEKLKDYASENNIVFIDLNKGLSSDSDGLLKDYTYDGIHLNGLGYAVWRDIIAEHAQ